MNPQWCLDPQSLKMTKNFNLKFFWLILFVLGHYLAHFPSCQYPCLSVHLCDTISVRNYTWAAPSTCDYLITAS